MQHRVDACRYTIQVPNRFTPRCPPSNFVRVTIFVYKFDRVKIKISRKRINRKRFESRTKFPAISDKERDWTCNDSLHGCLPPVILPFHVRLSGRPIDPHATFRRTLRIKMYYLRDNSAGNAGAALGFEISCANSSELKIGGLNYPIGSGYSFGKRFEGVVALATTTTTTTMHAVGSRACIPARVTQWYLA